MDAKPTGSHRLHRTRTDEGVEVVQARDEHGRFVGQLTLDRVQQLWARYNMARGRESPAPFPEEVARLLQRYKTGRSANSAATGKVKMTNHWTLPAEYMEAVRRTVGQCRERFASPLNVSWETTEYWTAFVRDRVFGTKHDAYSEVMTGASEANPEYE